METRLYMVFKTYFGLVKSYISSTHEVQWESERDTTRFWTKLWHSHNVYSEFLNNIKFHQNCQISLFLYFHCIHLKRKMYPLRKQSNLQKAGFKIITTFLFSNHLTIWWRLKEISSKLCGIFCVYKTTMMIYLPTIQTLQITIGEITWFCNALFLFLYNILPW